MEYFTSEGSKTIGPFSKEELKQRNISGSTLIYTEETNWVEAKSISDLSDIVRKMPPPPPPQAEKRDEPKYQTMTASQETKKGSRGWLYGLLLVLGLGGGGTAFYNQQQETQRLQDEVRSRDLQKQEEQAKAEREKKRAEIESAKQQWRSRKASLQTEYNVQQDKLAKAEEWQFLRSGADRENAIRIINTNLRRIEDGLRECNEQLEELENTNY